MHVKSTNQNKFPMSLGTNRNKPHSKPLLEPKPATSPVSLGRQADGPRLMVRDLRSDGPQVMASNTEPLHKNVSLEFSTADSPPSTPGRSAVHFQILHRTDAFLELISSLYGGRSAPPDRTVRGYCSSTIADLFVQVHKHASYCIICIKLNIAPIDVKQILLVLS